MIVLLCLILINICIRGIREVGAASTILLKNTKGALPLKKPVSIAVIGMYTSHQ
jgi:hypothetical protein